MAAVTGRAVETAAVAGSTKYAETSSQSFRSDAPVPVASLVNEVVELFAWAQRTRGTSQRLRIEADELKETVIQLRDAVPPPDE